MKDSREGSHDDPVICRCESIGLKHLQQTILQSKVSTVNQLKKLTRAGMGPCQGRTCARSLERLLEIEAGIPAGTEAFCPDVMPIIGPVPEIDNSIFSKKMTKNFQQFKV